MILLTLAAFAQAPTVAATTRDNAMTCAAATAFVAGEATVRVNAQANYHVMEAARADLQGKPFTDRYRELMSQLGSYARPLVNGGSMGRATEIVQECDRIHPLARGMAAATLPSDPFERDLMCLGVVSFLEAMGRQMPPGGAPTHHEIMRAQEALAQRLPDSRTQAAGLNDTAAVMRRTGELLGRSVDFGNSEMVGRACLAELRG